VLDFLSADRGHLTFRLGVQFRDPLQPAPAPESLLPARYVRLQVASPPPGRVDGTAWDDGLVVTGGGPFKRADQPPKDGRVDPLGGIAPLGQPDPKTIVFDRWFAVPAVPPTRALTRTFAMGTANPAIRPLSFLSVPYPDPRINGKRLAVAGVDYYSETKIEFDREVDSADGDWIVAVSLDRFFPPERASADYIVRVFPPRELSTEQRAAAPEFPINVAWPDSAVTAASRSSPESP
jgi:hypothetical protein